METQTGKKKPYLLLIIIYSIFYAIFLPLFSENVLAEPSPRWGEWFAGLFAIFSEILITFWLVKGLGNIKNEKYPWVWYIITPIIILGLLLNLAIPLFMLYKI